MDNGQKQAKRYDPALETQAQLERSNQRVVWVARTLRGLGALLVLSVAKLHLSTLAGRVAGIVGPLCFLAAWIFAMWAKSRESGPEYLSILEPEGAGDFRTTNT
jgi:hypothetical protein